MRAAVIDAPRTASLRQAPRPEPGPGQVRVRVEGSGVCGSNLAVWQGQPWFTYPLASGAPGHEGWGTVDAVGDGVTAPAPGARVAFLSSHAFAEWDIAAADEVVALPAAIGSRPFPGEALACAVNVIRRAAIVPGQQVAVIGVGFLGAVVVRLASLAGARVIAASRRPFALEVARAQGAEATVELRDPGQAAGELLSRGGAAGFACAIEAAGTQVALDTASAVVGVRGRLVVAGYHQDGPRQVDMQSWNWRGIDVINAHERDPRAYVAGMREAVEAVAAGAWNPDALITHRFGLDQVHRALDLLHERPAGFLKAVVLT